MIALTGDTLGFYMSTVEKEDIERALKEKNPAKLLIERLQNSPDRDIGGRITWTRDELHER